MKRIFPMRINEINSQISVRSYKTHFLEVDSKDKNPSCNLHQSSYGGGKHGAGCAGLCV